MKKEREKKSIAKQRGTKKVPQESAEKSGITKQYVKARSACKVTFRLPKDAAPDASKVTLVGDFNDWDKSNILMEKLKNGEFTKTVELKVGRAYRFKYLIDDQQWENDWSADRYEPNPYGNDDSVVII